DYYCATWHSSAWVF
nr:immunoglobulin light chain junction region [Macaca mulatta]